MSTEEDFVPTTDDVIRARLLHVLTVYPGISPSMLQVGIGTAISPKMWHPVMAKLKESGAVKEEEFMAQAPNGRDLNYKRLFAIQQNRPENYPHTGFACSECGEPQFRTPSGDTCKNGHGGSPAA